MSAIVIMILVVIVALGLFAFGQKIFTKQTGEGEIETCRLSVLSQAETEVGIKSPLSLDCKRRYVDIYDTKVKLGVDPDKTNTINIYENGEKKKSFKELNSDIVNYVIAEEMRICWYEFDEAKTDIFPNEDPTLAIVQLGATDKTCFICSQINFDDSIKNNKFTDLLAYLKKTYVKDKKYTYNEYLNMPSLSEKSWDELTQDKLINTDYFEKTPENDIIIDSSKDIAIVFYKDSDSSKVGDLAKSVFGSSKKGVDAYYVYVIPIDNIEDICQVQAS